MKGMFLITIYEFLLLYNHVHREGEEDGEVTNFYTKRLWPKDRSLSTLQTAFDRKLRPFFLI